MPLVRHQLVINVSLAKCENFRHVHSPMQLRLHFETRPNGGTRKKAASAAGKSTTGITAAGNEARDQRDMLQYVEKGMAMHGLGQAVGRQVCDGELAEDFVLLLGPINGRLFLFLGVAFVTLDREGHLACPSPYPYIRSVIRSVAYKKR